MSEFTGHIQFLSNIGFGDMVKIEMYRYGVKNEFYIHKVVGLLNSNSWTETPLKYNSEEKLHDHMEEVLNVIQCGIDETKVIRVAAKDVTKIEKQPKIYEVQELNENQSLSLWAMKNRFKWHSNDIESGLLEHLTTVSDEIRLDNKEFAQVLQAFAAWALDQC